LEIKELQPIVNFIYSVADDILVNYYEKAKYKDIILPMTVIRRLDAVLEPTKEKVVEVYNQYKDKLDDMDDLLGGKNGSNLGFHNHSNFTLKSLLDDPSNIKSNFENYLNGFSANVQDILEKFEFRNQVAKLDRTGNLYLTIQKFCSSTINLSPNTIKDENGNIIHHGLSNLGMGYVFEELLRQFNEDENAQAGKHFTPREIISLMTNLVFIPIKDEIKEGTYFIYDNACGSGGIFCYGNDFLYNKPSVLFGRKGTVDKPLFVEKPFWTVDTMFYSEIKENVYPKFFFLLAKTIDFNKYKSGSVLPSMTQEDLSNIKLPLP